MKRISDEEIVKNPKIKREWIDRKGKPYCYFNPFDVAEAQLEADKKATENMVEIIPREAEQIIIYFTFATSGFFTDKENNLIAKLKPIAERKDD